MNIKVVYQTKTGNTKKVAEAIADELGVKAQSIDSFEDFSADPVDLLFLGSGLYFENISKEVKAFIDMLDPKQINAAAVFSTSGSANSFGIINMTKRLEKRGIAVSDRSFKCHGAAFGTMFPTHPDEEDLNAARQFAQDVADK